MTAATVTRTCSLEGCDRPHLARGWCHTHYERRRTTGDVGPVEIGPRHYACSVEGCDRPHRARGYCASHHQRWRKTGDPGPAEIRELRPGAMCSVEGCDRPHSCRGLCNTHYSRWKRTGDVGRAVEIKPPGGRIAYGCSVDGCDRPHGSQGLCRAHYWRQHNKGDVGPVEILDYFAEVPAYRTMHWRIKAARGSASEHACCDCGRPAREWSYSNDDPDELVSDKGLRYSTDLDRYAPRCQPCHRRFDLATGGSSCRRFP